MKTFQENNPKFINEQGLEIANTSLTPRCRTANTLQSIDKWMIE